MIYEYNKLRGRIREKCGTQDCFASALGIGRVSLSQRLNGKLEFTQEEISKSIDILELQKTDIPEYFFKAKGLEN